MGWQRLRAPGVLMAMAVAISALGAAATLYLSAATPWLGLHLSPDGQVVRIVSAAPSGPAAAAPAQGVLLAINGVAVSAEDVMEEPDTLNSYRGRAAFQQRQGRLAAQMRQPRVRLEIRAPDGERRTLVVVPRPSRPLTSLPAVFWIQIVSGSASFLIGGLVWAMKPRDAGTRLLALSGAALLLSANAAAVYSTRELALPPGLFKALSLSNLIGTMFFGPSLVTLFLCYPKRLASRAVLVSAFVALGLPPFVIMGTKVMPPMDATYGMVAVDMVMIVSLIGWQWRSSRDDPRGRAALRWLGLLVAFGVGAFTFSTAAPLLLGYKAALSQGYTFLFFVLIYVGLALGLRRYRLFELNTWAFRILFYMGAALAFLTVDAILIWALNVGQARALGAALAAVIFVYLPLRDWLWRRTVGRRDIHEHDLVDGVTRAALGATTAERARQWENTLDHLFDPLEIEPIDTELTRPDIAEEGLELLVPATSDSPALRLRYPWAGRGLFSPAHLSLARQAYALLRRLEIGRDAYAQGAMAERRRIARDLHDDVGARLLTGLHEAGPDTRPLLRAALADVRAIVGGLTGERRALARVMADLRFETARRLDAAEIALDWPVDDHEAPEILLDYEQYKNLSSAFREVISNLIRHSGARCARVELAQTDDLVIEVSDDGCGMHASENHGRGGHGLRNIAERLAAIGGDLSFRPVDQGCCVRMSLRLTTPPVLGMLTPQEVS